MRGGEGVEAERHGEEHTRQPHQEVSPGGGVAGGWDWLFLGAQHLWLVCT